MDLSGAADRKQNGRSSSAQSSALPLIISSAVWAKLIIDMRTPSSSLSLSLCLSIRPLCDYFRTFFPGAANTRRQINLGATG